MRVVMPRGRTILILFCLTALSGVLVPAARAASDFVNFESGQVRPLALSTDGTHLYAVNTPDARLEIFSIIANGALVHVGDVEVGLEPVALAVHNSAEVWVVNHLSDSVSVVDVSDPTEPRVTATLWVGDEPRDIVFAGSAGNRVFITTAHRGQNRPGDPQLTTAGIGRADVWVFDADDLTAAPSIVTLFGDTPRALAASPDGSRVYAAVFESGNQTTTISETLTNTGGGGLGLPPPSIPNTTGVPPPSTGLIVKFDGSAWIDELHRNWSFRVPFSFADKDVFVIDADANPPAEIPSEVARGVGTTIFNMAVNPASGVLYVSNTEAHNEVRFEPVIHGHIAESRVTIVDGTNVQPVHLNPHINYARTPGSLREVRQSLAFPMGMAFTADGEKLYVAAFGSNAVGELDNSGRVRRRILVGRGPSGVALDEPNKRLYVMNRIENSISVVNTASRRELGRVPLHFDPSPLVVKHGRQFLYDAHISGHGDSACASCHTFGDFDGLAWDLGDPTGTVVPNPNPFLVGSGQPYHPMKGPMTTQSLRGLVGAGSMHWRGDRNGGPADPLNEDLSFKQFNPAFVSLLGAPRPLSPQDMQAFTDFALTIVYPPNPIENLDRTLTPQQQAGKDFFTTTTVDAGVLKCVGCHALPLGTGGASTIEGEPQEFKVAHLRNAYQKIGLFDVPGEQVRSFGFLHDGSVANVFDFLHAAVFSFGSNPDVKRRNVEAFVLSLDTGLAPAVGQDVTANATNLSDTTVTDRINLLMARADAGDCDLIVKGMLNGEARGWLYNGSGQFRSDRSGEPLLAAATLLSQAAVSTQERSYTCVPPGSGTRMAIDRDSDGSLDRTEIDTGSDPAVTGDTAVCQPLALRSLTVRAIGEPVGNERLSLSADFAGLLPQLPNDNVQIVISTDHGPLLDTTIAGDNPAFHLRRTSASYRNAAGMNQRVTSLALSMRRNSETHVTVHMSKADLASAAGASVANVAVYIVAPDTGVTACGRATAVPCTPNRTGTTLTCR